MATRKYPYTSVPQADGCSDGALPVESHRRKIYWHIAWSGPSFDDWRYLCHDLWSREQRKLITDTLKVKNPHGSKWNTE
ncbi:hypothetical protein ElyMa_003369800 [Elysia marginata]|uniref:Spondin domain-containing protein n=1 Tax=Elysia marginata TaxID=1093978 RepID=A0AAV4JIQ6_9GAST|nr:hypothetical protein ElyMa_003369800 [Elysia marginata]